ncbi:MAG: Ada metal-binding domain-containing protein, partial [Pyrinomonadaceae bacterium]
SALFAKIRGIGPEHARLAGVLERAAEDDPAATPSLLDLVEVKSKLPAWMTAPPEIEVMGRTREVRRADIPGFEGGKPWPRRSQRRTPTTPASDSVQSIFSAQPAQTVVAPLDPSDIRGNTFAYAKKFVGDTGFYFWWIPLHNFILEVVWEGFGVTEGFAALLMSLLFCSVVILTYAFLRALHVAETSPGALQPPADSFPLPTPAQPAPPLPASLHGSPTLFPQTHLPTGTAHDPVVGNKGLKIYHLPDCEWAGKISPPRRVDFPSAAPAQQDGYRPCKVCAP